MSKSDFIRSLQVETKALSPFDISQRLRQLFACVSMCRWDEGLNPDKYRGYMLWPDKKPMPTPDDPELYVCVIATKQSKAHIDVTWTKEILHILDAPSHRTDAASLEHMLGNREIVGRNGNGAPPNVVADVNGLTLALGCMVPQRYRSSLRSTTKRLSDEELEAVLSVPAEYVPWLLSDKFEDDFEAALATCDL